MPASGKWQVLTTPLTPSSPAVLEFLGVILPSRSFLEQQWKLLRNHGSRTATEGRQGKHSLVQALSSSVFKRATVVDTSIRVQTTSAGGPSGKNLENFPLWNSHSSQAVPRFLIILLLIYFVTSRWWFVVMQGDSECLGVYGAHATLLDT